MGVSAHAEQTQCPQDLRGLTGWAVRHRDRADPPGACGARLWRPPHKVQLPSPRPSPSYPFTKLSCAVGGVAAGPGPPATSPQLAAGRGGQGA